MKSRREQRRGAQGAVGKQQHLHELNEANCNPVLVGLSELGTSDRFYKTWVNATVR